MTGFDAMALLQARVVMRQWDHPKSGDWAEVLASFPLFAGVRKRHLRKLVRSATIAEYAAGTTVLSEGESADSLYLILGGAAKVPRKPAARALGVGDYFGELALIDSSPRSATVIATQELHVMKLPSQSVLRLAQRHHRITLTMLRNLSTQNRRLETQIARSV